MAGLREKNKTLREQRIVTAAEHLFLKNGYVDTRIEDIAAEAEVSVGTIYNYFQNKTDMLLRIVAQGDEAIARELSELSADPPADPIDYISSVFEISTLRSMERLGRENWRHLLATSIIQQDSDLGVRYLALTERLKGRLRAALRDLEKQEKLQLGDNVDQLAEILFLVEGSLYLKLISSDSWSFERYSRGLRDNLRFMLDWVK